MYLRKAKTKDGRIYLSIVQSYRDANGKAKSKTVRSLGYLDELTSESCPDPIAKYEAECAHLNAEAKATNAPIMVRLSSAKKIEKKPEDFIELGSAIPSKYFHIDLGIGCFFERRRTARGFAYDPCRILELLVWNRIAHHSSNKAAWEARRSFPRKCDFSLNDLYHCLDYLYLKTPDLINHVNETMKQIRGPRSTKRLCYNVINYYFEVRAEKGSHREQTQRTHETRPIVQMGLLTDDDDLPFDMEVLPGHADDASVILPSVRKAAQHLQSKENVERIVVVADKGFNNAANIQACIADGSGFIFPRALQDGAPGMEEWALDEAGYTKQKGGRAKSKSRIIRKSALLTFEDGETKEIVFPIKEVVFWSEGLLDRSRGERAKIIEESVRTLDDAEIFADEALDGYYCLSTSELDMSDLEIIETYRKHRRIEESFLDSRPTYVSDKERICAHFLICYISMLIMRLIRVDIGYRYTTKEIVEALRNIVGHHLDANTYLFNYRTDLTDGLAQLAGIDLSRQALTRGQIRSIMAAVKSVTK